MRGREGWEEERVVGKVELRGREAEGVMERGNDGMFLKSYKRIFRHLDNASVGLTSVFKVFQ